MMGYTNHCNLGSGYPVIKTEIFAISGESCLLDLHFYALCFVFSKL